MKNDEILTKGELAKLLKVTVRTVDRLRNEGLPSFKVGNLVRFDKNDVKKWLKSQQNSNEVVA